jgi:hypothetical protein
MLDRIDWLPPAGASMSRARRGVLGLLAVALAAGCSIIDKEPTVSFEDAERRVVALVDDTLTAALPGRQLGQAYPVERQPCYDALGAPSENVSLHFEREFPIEGPPAERLVADTERVWRERGYALESDDVQQDVPIRYVTVDGYSMSLVVNRTTKQAHLGVSSPCVRPPS